MTGALSLTGWAGAVLAAFVVVVCMLAFIRGGAEGRAGPALQVVLVLILALTGWWAVDQMVGRDLAAERRAVDARAFELAKQALTPGSALACLDAIAGETVEEACDKALFASPEATAAAVSYVSAQLSLLAAIGEPARGAPGSATARTSLRRAIEADRFGIVAHVLAVRDGCTPDRCAAFALLQNSRRISVNLAERPFEALVRSHAAAWPSGGGTPVASSPPAAAAPAGAPALAGAKPPNNLYFPSAASIPPVNIMTAEPAAPPNDTTGAADATTPTPPRKPPAGGQPARQPPSANSAPARPAPMQLAPSAQ